MQRGKELKVMTEDEKSEGERLEIAEREVGLSSAIVILQRVCRMKMRG